MVNLQNSIRGTLDLTNFPPLLLKEQTRLRQGGGCFRKFPKFAINRGVNTEAWLMNDEKGVIDCQVLVIEKGGRARQRVALKARYF